MTYMQKVLNKWSLLLTMHVCPSPLCQSLPPSSPSNEAPPIILYPSLHPASLFHITCPSPDIRLPFYLVTVCPIASVLLTAALPALYTASGPQQVSVRIWRVNEWGDPITVTWKAPSPNTMTPCGCPSQAALQPEPQS